VVEKLSYRQGKTLVSTGTGKGTTFSRATQSLKVVRALAPEVTFFMTALPSSGPLENPSLWGCGLAAGGGERLGVDLVEFFEPACGVGD
jgi:hypothetical protein